MTGADHANLNNRLDRIAGLLDAILQELRGERDPQAPHPTAVLTPGVRQSLHPIRKETP